MRIPTRSSAVAVVFALAGCASQLPVCRLDEGRFIDAEGRSLDNPVVRHGDLAEVWPTAPLDLPVLGSPKFTNEGGLSHAFSLDATVSGRLRANDPRLIGVRACVDLLEAREAAETVERSRSFGAVTTAVAGRAGGQAGAIDWWRPAERFAHPEIGYNALFVPLGVFARAADSGKMIVGRARLLLADDVRVFDFAVDRPTPWLELAPGLYFRITEFQNTENGSRLRYEYEVDDFGQVDYTLGHVEQVRTPFIARAALIDADGSERDVSLGGAGRGGRRLRGEGGFDRGAKPTTWRVLRLAVALRTSEAWALFHLTPLR